MCSSSAVIDGTALISQTHAASALPRRATSTIAASAGRGNRRCCARGQCPMARTCAQRMPPWRSKRLRQGASAHVVPSSVQEERRRSLLQLRQCLVPQGLRGGDPVTYHAPYGHVPCTVLDVYLPDLTRTQPTQRSVLHWPGYQVESRARSIWCYQARPTSNAPCRLVDMTPFQVLHCSCMHPSVKLCAQMSRQACVCHLCSELTDVRVTGIHETLQHCCRGARLTWPHKLGPSPDCERGVFNSCSAPPCVRLPVRSTYRPASTRSAKLCGVRMHSALHAHAQDLTGHCRTNLQTFVSLLVV